MKIKLPYGCQNIDEDDVKSVICALESKWLTTGPFVEQFEKEVAKYCGSKFGVAVSSGTAALHAAMYAADIGPGDEVIVPSMTFAATANAIVYCGGKPVFCDVDTHNLLMDIDDIESKITGRTKAIISVDYAGQPADYLQLIGLAEDNNLILIDDACHALGAYVGILGRSIGNLSDLTIFSFHPVKTITTGEGGMIMTNDEKYVEKMRMFRNHGISVDARRREEKDSWQYDMVDLGYNYRITDIQCALGISQINKIDNFVQKRNDLADRYDYLFKYYINFVEPLDRLTGYEEDIDAYHLYVVKFKEEKIRNHMFHFLRKKGIGVNVHYKPVHLHSYYKEKYNTCSEMCPVSEACYRKILTLPLHPGMEENDVDTVVNLMKKGIRTL